MPQDRTKISSYADELLSVPSAHLRMELRQDENGVSLHHRGNAVVECPLSPEGMMAAGWMAEALGERPPALGQSVSVRVSTGVLYRAIGIAGLDYGKEESFVLLERLLEEARQQRGGVSDSA